jgi:hypothetical protein
MKAAIVATVAASCLVFGAGAAGAQQVADPSFDPKVARPAYPTATGPRVLIDEAHHNFHTLSGNYRPFGRLLEADGYRVSANTRPFSGDTLRKCRVLVIANAMGGDEVESYGMAAFSETECDTLAEWVRLGGSLLLIADHAPFGTGAEELAKRFHVGMSKGFTEDTLHCAAPGRGSILIFTRDDQLVRDDVITRGRDSTEIVNRVVAYTGQSLAPPVGARALLALSPQAFDHPSPTVEQARKSQNPGFAWYTEVAGQATTSARGRVVGLALRYGLGRVVILGEAAMLTAQVVSAPGKPVRKAGMNEPGNDNRQFALNVMHWLSGVLAAE